MTPAPMMTTEDYFKTPESNRPQELAYGVWRVADAPTPRHQSAVFAFAQRLDRFVRHRGLGRVYLSPVDVVLDERRHLVVQPDLVFVSAARLGIVRERIWGAPDLALEVLSPRPRVGEVDERLRWFATYGVQECWLLHQDRRVLEVIEFREGLIRTRHDYLEDVPIRSRLLPEWRHTLAEVLDGFNE